MANRYTGGCLCGAVRYEIDAEPMIAAHCQCRDCQRMTGAGHASFMAFPQAAIRLSGQLKSYEIKADSGHLASRNNCIRCGSFVTGGSTAMPDATAIAASTLDDASAFAPQMVIFASRGQPWDQLDPALPRFPAMPPLPVDA